MTASLRLALLAAACLGLSHLAAAQSQDGAPAPELPTLNGVTINGPAPPAGDETIARDGRGRVTLRATRITEPLTIDGRLDERLYNTIKPIGGFVQTEPGRGEPATESTEVWIFFDEDTIYIGARCYDSSPEERWVANEMRRDSNNIPRGENIAFYFDTFYDRRNAFLFEISPIGGIYDSYVTNERPPGNIDYNPVWDRQVGRFEKGWTVEMAIPFRALRYKPGAAQVWGVNIRRTVRWKNEESFVQTMPPNQGSVLFQISLGGTLVGIDAPSGSRNLELKPYGIAGFSNDFVARPDETDRTAEAGFDVKYGLTQNLTADFTYNTDFAQVEVDEQQVNLTRFPLFFPEKRDFFLEGAGIFDFGGASASTGNVGLTPLLFFSRQIGLSGNATVPIDVGGRLTGKVGPFTLGVIDVRTGDTDTIEPTNFSVVRVKRDLLRRSSIGFLYTGRSHAPDHPDSSQSYGVDAAIGLYDNWQINTYYAKTDNPEAGDDDESYRGQILYNGDRYGLQYERLVVGDDFNPQVGFLRRDAFGRQFAQFRFSPRPKRSLRVRKYTYQATYDYIANREGRLETREASGVFNIAFQNGDQLSVSGERNYELLLRPFPITPDVRIPIGAYGFGELSAGFSLGNQRKVAGTMTVARGSFYDGDRTAVSFTGARIELSPRLSAEPGISLNFVDLPEGQFTTRLLSARGTFTATPRLFFTGLVQANSSNRVISSNFRMRWEYSPGSELFVVYTDEQDTPVTGPIFTRNRAFVIKINRLFQF